MRDITDRFKKTLENLENKLGSVRTGRANPDLLSSVNVAYYGASIPIKQLAAISVADGNVLQLSVFDGGAVSAIERAIQTSDLGLNPQTDGTVIRLRLPDLTAERREELIKYVKKLVEDAKVSMRNIRRDEMDTIKKKDVSDDEKKLLQDDVQQLLDTYIKKVDDRQKEKEADIRTV